MFTSRDTYKSYIRNKNIQFISYIKVKQRPINNKLAMKQNTTKLNKPKNASASILKESAMCPQGQGKNISKGGE